MKKLLILFASILLLFACNEEKSDTIAVSISSQPGPYTFTVQGATPPIKLYVYSKSGSPVFEETYQTTTFNWNGKTTNDNNLADGMYTFLVKDSDGNAKDGVIYLITKK